MRKFYFFCFIFLFGITTLIAQSNHVKPNMISINEIYPYNNTVKNLNNKTVSCTDTVRYPGSKLTGLVEADTMKIGYIEGVSQAYHFSGNATISGISAYVLLDLDGIAGNSSPIIMTIKVYNINATNHPTTLIDSTVVQVMDVGYQEQVLMFTNPIAVSDSFAVALEINPAFPVRPYYVTNTSANNDGNGEALSCVTFAWTYYNAYTQIGGWDMDLMLAPIMNLSITSSYTTDKDSICPNDTVVFTNTSSINTDAMFNLYNTTTNPLYTWDFNDGTGTYNPFDTSYVFSSPATYNTQLSANYYGYSLNCMDVNSVSIVVHDTAVANFGFLHLGGGVYQFSDSSANANTYSWNFGDASPVDNGQNPTHTYTTANSYTVCLTVTDSNGCNIDSICKVVNFTLSVDDYTTPSMVNIFPIPANKYFNVNLPSNYFGGEIILTDVVGKTLKKVNIDNQNKVKVTTEGILAGIYFVSIDYGGERVFTKRIVIDK